MEIKFQGLTLLFDDDMVGRIRVSGVCYRGYVSGALDGGRYGLIHRHIMNPPKGYAIHHKNGDKLDNRRGNLEIKGRKQHLYHHMGEAGEKILSQMHTMLKRYALAKGITYKEAQDAFKGMHIQELQSEHRLVDLF